MKIDKLLLKSIRKNEILRISGTVFKKNINGEFAILYVKTQYKAIVIETRRNEYKDRQIFHWYRKPSMETNGHTHEIF